MQETKFHNCKNRGGGGARIDARTWGSNETRDSTISRNRTHEVTCFYRYETNYLLSFASN